MGNIQVGWRVIGDPRSLEDRLNTYDLWYDIQICCETFVEVTLEALKMKLRVQDVWVSIAGKRKSRDTQMYGILGETHLSSMPMSSYGAVLSLGFVRIVWTVCSRPLIKYQWFWVTVDLPKIGKTRSLGKVWYSSSCKGEMNVVQWLKQVIQKLRLYQSIKFL